MQVAAQHHAIAHALPHAYYAANPQAFQDGTLEHLLRGEGDPSDAAHQHAVVSYLSPLCPAKPLQYCLGNLLQQQCHGGVHQTKNIFRLSLAARSGQPMSACRKTYHLMAFCFALSAQDLVCHTAILLAPSSCFGAFCTLVTCSGASCAVHAMCNSCGLTRMSPRSQQSLCSPCRCRCWLRRKRRWPHMRMLRMLPSSRPAGSSWALRRRTATSLSRPLASPTATEPVGRPARSLK